MAKQLLLSLTKKDFDVQTFRSGGPGGQDEEWHQVEDFPDYYVSSLGRVMSTKHGKLRELKQQTDSYGYKHVGLVRKRNGETKKVADLVAQAFLGPKPPGLYVCHGKEGQANNSVSNLRYDTQAENVRDIYTFGCPNPPSGERNGMSRLTTIQVLAIREEAESGAQLDVLVSKYRMSRRQLRDIISRRAWKSV